MFQLLSIDKKILFSCLVLYILQCFVFSSPSAFSHASNFWCFSAFLVNILHNLHCGSSPPSGMMIFASGHLRQKCLKIPNLSSLSPAQPEIGHLLCVPLLMFTVNEAGSLFLLCKYCSGFTLCCYSMCYCSKARCMVLPHIKH